MNPEILILDEASAMLDPRGRRGLMRVCKELHAQGMTIVMITHFMEEAAEADRIIVLEKGLCVLDGSPKEVLTQDEKLRTLNLAIPFATKISRMPQDRGLPVSTHVEHREPLKEELCRLRSNTVSFSYNPLSKRQIKAGETPKYALKNVSFSLEDGEFLAIAGHTGSGKSTLTQHLNGLVHPTEGRVLWKGKDLANKKTAIEARGDIGLVFQYPEHQLFAASVYEDVAFGPRNLGLSSHEVEERVREALDQVNLSFDELRDVSPFELSGGQQRRVAFAGVLAMRPSVLVLDEPVAGLDPASREDFLTLIEKFHRSGLTILMVSSQRE